MAAAMKLLDLDPRWLIEDGRKVGFVFRSPTKPDKFWQTCFLEAGRKTFCCAACSDSRDWCCPHSQMGLVMRAGVFDREDGCSDVQGCKFECAWKVTGELDFSVLTVTPSIDGSAGGLWHGFITNGEIS